MAKGKRTSIAKDKLEELKRKSALADQYLEDVKRLKAEFDNYRKRMDAQIQRIQELANEELVKELLNVLDSFDRAEQMEGASPSFLEGLRLVRKQLESVLARCGLKRMDVVGKEFDPVFHEAVMCTESDAPASTIIKEVRGGYTLKDKVIRPAQVIVSAKGGG
jgi:molecular chaperone GrpE